MRRTRPWNRPLGRRRPAHPNEPSLWAANAAATTDPRDCDTERYLGLPQEHADACANIGKLRVHGTADDNVLFFHTPRLSDPLLSARYQVFAAASASSKSRTLTRITASQLMGPTTSKTRPWPAVASTMPARGVATPCSPASCSRRAGRRHSGRSRRSAR
ncbi:hypothetical protein D7V93_17510 [Corallococcus llansteffanensis]|uniref:Uncharacterized protein n=1 Tax=Corallococcus llansteffanensis TaxID=2316731 RepID=A0A3A8PNT7_9BACT|nr:hypothetical protein D7V93_17510 [Corallococcus llansteffanensis]